MKTTTNNENPKNILGYLMAFAMVLFSLNVNAQCFNTSAYGSAVAPTSGTTTISTCNYLTEYATISSVVAGSSYTCAISGASASPGYVTIEDAANPGVALAHGPSPFGWTAVTSGTHYVHWTVDAACVTATGCHTSTIMYGLIVLGCTDSTASNYNPLANVDDGSCVFSGCTSGIGANSESFEDPAVALYGQGPWANWTYDAASSTFSGTNGWRKDNLGTGSSGTGPVNGQPSLDGDYYLYCETSGQYNMVANLHSSCVDLSTFTAPAFVFGYHMLGATMGTLNVDVSTDGGTTWVNEWTATGDQGSAWLEGIIDLSTSYAGQLVQVRMNYTSGTSFTGDCAIDFLRFMEAPVSGCMDQWAANYNPLATIDDGSCIYPGCTDPTAMNYCASCNVDCDTIAAGTNYSCCIYPSVNATPMCEDFESANFLTNSWVTNSGSLASVTLQTGTFIVNPASQNIGPLNDTVSLHFEGGSVASTWNLTNTETAAYSNTTNIATAQILMDLSNASSACEMSFNVELYSGFSNSRYCNLRVKVDGVVIPDVAGNTSYWTGTGSTLFPWAAAGAPHLAVYNMSAYSGQSSVNVTFEFVGRYGSGYSSGMYGCHAQVDDICFYDLTPCYYFAASTSVIAEPQCNGDLTGTASVSASSGSGATSYFWDNTSTNDTIGGLAAGTYIVIATDDTLGCVDTASVTITEPSAMTLTGIITPSSTLLSNNGSIDLTVSGATPCITATSLSSHNPLHSSNGQSGIHFNIINNALGNLTITDLSQGSYSYSGANTMDVYYRQGGMGTPLHAATGWTQCAASVPIIIPTGGSFAAPVYSASYAITPVVIPAGDTCGFYIQGMSSFSYATATSSGVVGSVVASDANISITSGYGGTPLGTGSFSPRAPIVEVYYGTPGAQAYTFAWSNGDSTEDISGLGMGPVSVTATDCNG